MKIGDREIGPGHPPFVIAEVSCNHGGSLERALALIEVAYACGADAVKFQATTAETITLDCDRPEFTIKDGPWKGQRLYELYKRTETPFEWFPEIKAHAEKVGITWFASVFSHEAVDLMHEMGAPAIKIASFEIVDLPLIKYAASLGVPMILSTGMADYDEIKEAADLVDQNRLALLHCVSGYPTKAEDANLWRLGDLHFQFAGPWGSRPIIGISDHSAGVEIPVAATARGAEIIEKHFRLSWHPDTEDSPFSADEADLHRIATAVRDVWDAMRGQQGDVEASSRQLRRSLFAVADIKAGERLTLENVRSIRPGDGLPPKVLPQILGLTALRDIERGEPLCWDMINELKPGAPSAAARAQAP